MTPSILFENNHVLVVNKPAGMLTQPSGTTQANIQDWAKLYIKTKYNKPGNVFLEAIHRIDKPVSGLVLFGKTSKALSRLNESMREKNSKKIYLALVKKGKLPQQGILEHYLIHGEHRAHVSHAKDKEAKASSLSYKIIGETNKEYLLEIDLHTGRYHQIRVQLAEIGFPIIGDHKYGSDVPFLYDTIALHNRKLIIPNPITKELETFEAPLPDYWPPTLN